MEIVSELNERAGPWRNMVIEGDNYDALRWLRMTMAGTVKAIYIDPPYNTGNKDWVYNDHYVSRDDRYRHSTWLEFLYRRLSLARDLLTDDGVIFVSISDEQRAKVELLLDEVMPGMRVGSFAWKTRAGTKGEAPFFGQDHEHVLVYARPKFFFLGDRPDETKYRNLDSDPRGPWVSVALQTNKDRFERPNSYFSVVDPLTGNHHPCNPNRVWSFQLRGMKGARGPSFEDLYEADLVLFSDRHSFDRYETVDQLKRAITEGKAHHFLTLANPDLEQWVGKRIGRGSVRKKQFLRELKGDRKIVSSWISKDKSTNSADEPPRRELRSAMNAEGTAAIMKLFGRKAFNYAKPPSLIRELLRQSTSTDDIVLDFFAGSSTTAQATLELNAEDGGDRRFLMVSSTEATSAESEKNLCRDVTAERIRRLNAAGELPTSFAYLRARRIDFADIDYDLEPASVWCALEVMHGLPLTTYDGSLNWNCQEGYGSAVVLVDKPDRALSDWVAARHKDNIFIYAWAPGQVEAVLAGLGVDVIPVRQTLVRRFMA